MLTLDTAINLAVENNPEMRVLSASIAAARGEVTTALTWDNPEFAVTPGAFRDSAGTWGHVGFELKQTILFPGKRALLRAAAEKDVELRRLAMAGFRNQLAIQVRRAFYELLAARHVVGLKQQYLTLAKSFVEAAQKKVQGGFAGELEPTKAEVEMAMARKALREAEAQEIVARAELNSLLGRRPDTPLFADGKLDESISVPALDSLLDRAVQRNPSLKIQMAEAERAGLNLAVTRKSRWPDLAVGPVVEYQQPEQVYGFGISVPLPLWDQKKGAIATATAEQTKALAELEKLRRDVFHGVTAALQNLTAAKDSLAFFTPAMREKLKSALDAAAQGYAEGRTPLLLYLETQRTYFDLQSEYFETLQKLHAAQAEMESAVGISLPELFPTSTEQK